MYINAAIPNFFPENYAIVNFYGTEICFIWSEYSLVHFPFNLKDTQDHKGLQIIKVPNIVKDVKCFNERVFVLCKPNGIYKITDKLDLVPLSKSGIELGSDFAEVFTVSSKFITLEDKRTKTHRNLFPLDSNRFNLHVLTINKSECDVNFYKRLVPYTYDSDEIVNIVACNKHLFRLTKQDVKLIYTSKDSIKYVKAIQKCGKIHCVLLQCSSNYIIILHAINDDNQLLQFDTVYLATKVLSACVVVDNSAKNTALIIHTDGTQTFFTRKILNEESVYLYKTEDSHYKSLNVYKGKCITYLKHKELLFIPIDELYKNYEERGEHFIRLEQSMLRGLEDIIKEIHEKSKCLELLTKQLKDEQDVLKRLNLYALKHSIYYMPNIYVQKIMNLVFLTINYEKILPENSIVVTMLKSNGRTQFSMKKVTSEDTIVDLPVNRAVVALDMYTTTDLIAVKKEEGPWCLIRNYVQSPPPSKANQFHIRPETRDFLKLQLQTLESSRNNLTMADLSRIKRMIRKEVGDFKLMK